MVRYSIETRQSVLEAIENGQSVRDVAKRFDVSESFVRRLIRRKSETGSIAPLPRTNAGRKPKLNDEDLKKLRSSVLAEPCRTLREHREYVGVDCSLSVIHGAIKKLGLQDLRAKALDSGSNGDASDEPILAVSSPNGNGRAGAQANGREFERTAPKANVRQLSR